MNNKTIIFIILAIVLLGGLFLIFRPEIASIGDTEKIFSIEIQSKKIVTDFTTLKVNEGDQVTIKIIADEPEEFHLHGYDRSIDLEKDVETQLTFTANLTGRFVFELEDSKIELGALEVQPK